jgi:hypothetical protein
MWIEIEEKPCEHLSYVDQHNGYCGQCYGMLRVQILSATNHATLSSTACTYAAATKFYVINTDPIVLLGDSLLLHL